MSNPLVRRAAFVAFFLAATVPATRPATADDWTTIVEPYFLAPSMDGRTGIGDALVDVDADAGDILGALDFGAMLYLERRGPTMAWAIDASYMNLGATETRTLGTLTLDLRQSAAMLAAYPRANAWAEGLVGLTYNRIEAGIEGTGPLALDREMEKTWVDPTVGVRLGTNPERGFRVGFQGTIGGFGVGSDLAWQVYPQVGYRFGRTFELTGAFRAIHMDYADGEGPEAFRYDVTTSGPQAGLRFHF